MDKKNTKQPDKLPADNGDEQLLRERLKGQHEQMEGDSADMGRLDRTDRSDWPEGADITAAETPGYGKR